MGARGREIAVERVVAETMAVYEELLKKTLKIVHDQNSFCPRKARKESEIFWGKDLNLDRRIFWSVNIFCSCTFVLFVDR
jgi:hypothetical protein